MNLSFIASHLHALTSVNNVFQWEGKEQKENINTALVLALPDLQQPFEIETDASGYAMGLV